MTRKVLVKTRVGISGTPIGVVSHGEKICLISKSLAKTSSTLFLSWSDNGVDFAKDKEKVVILISLRKKELIKNCSDFSLSHVGGSYIMTYLRKAKSGDSIVVARSKDLYTWQVKSELPADGSRRSSVIYDSPKDCYELYRDGLFIKSQVSKTLAMWKEKPKLLFTSRNHHFDTGALSIIGSATTSDGVLLLYDASIISNKNTLIQVGAALFNINEPDRLIWRSEKPVWQGMAETPVSSQPIRPIGFASHNGDYYLYWVTYDGNLIVVNIPAVFRETEDTKRHPKILKRFHGNPILEPRNQHYWEGQGTFNPTVVEDDEGIIHLLYRAVGHDGLSRVGYAQSLDGMHFDKRSALPVFEPAMGYGMPDPKNIKGPVGYYPNYYTSGGGYGGSEDPRLTRIGDTIYMMYVAFEGWGSMRIALTSISVEDFKAGRWKWKRPTLISPPGIMAKNWLLFPEKIKGKYAILHGIVPKVMVDYVDDINNIEDYIYSPRPEGAPQPGRKDAWDGLVRGAGPTPVMTKIGWLILYHAIDKNDQSKYKLGAMILDKKDPSKVLYRSAHPILTPDMHYENNGKPGVIYASGMLIRGDDLYIYYGGADKVVCVAETSLKEFLEYLVTGNPEYYHLKMVKE